VPLLVKSCATAGQRQKTQSQKRSQPRRQRHRSPRERDQVDGGG
jgi:hypothetical protein